MRLIIISTEGFSFIVLAVLLYATIFETKRKTVKDRVFTWIVGVSLIPVTADMITYIFDGRVDLLPLLHICTSLTFLISLPLTMLFVLYLYYNISKEANPPRAFIDIPLKVTIAMTVVTLILCASGMLYSFDENAIYHVGDAYNVYMVSVLLSYVYAFFLLLRYYRYINHHDRVAFYCYAITPVLAVFINLAFPGLALSYSVTGISVLVAYIMLQGENQRAAFHRESILLETNYSDDLTGLRNHRAYTDACAKLDPAADVGIIFCDLNALKYTNDTLGHEQGDQLIRRFAALLLSLFDQSQVFRIGGDEFVVLLTDRSALLESAFYTRVSALSDKLVEDEHPVASMGSALGVAANLRDLIQQAEEQMYVQKAIFHRMNPQFGSSVTAAALELQAPVPKERAALTAEEQKILVLEQPGHQLVSSLLSVNYRVLECTTCEEALDLVQQHRGTSAVIVIDAGENTVAGSDFLRQIPAADRHIPILALVGIGSRETEERLLRLGVYDCIRRPFSPSLLLNRIERTIALQESRSIVSDVEFDELTGLYARQMFFHHIRRMLARNPGVDFDLLMFDIQDFKLINQRYGETLADSVLQAFGRCFRDLQSDSCLAGRYGIDQFCLLIKSSGDTRSTAERLIAELTDASPIAELVIKCGACENIDHNRSPLELCDAALEAVKTVKHRYGESYAQFNTTVRERINREQQLEREMVSAAAKGQFRVFYQPKHDVLTGRLIGAEALFRWVHPSYGMINPIECIPLFERTGFVTQVDGFVWSHTCENLRRWTDAGLPVVPISVNASRQDFMNKELLSGAESALHKCGLSRDLLHIEVTESLFTDRIDDLIRSLSTFRALGYKIELDDFGSGYSSLTTLSSLPVDVVKLDMSFMQSLDNERQVKVLSSCIQLIKNLGLTALCEGVETQKQCELLGELGCDVIQGFYYSRPLPENEFEVYMRHYNEFRPVSE